MEELGAVMKMKYIIVNGAFDLPTPFVFPETETHADVASRILANHAPEHRTVISAGFCDVAEDGWHCWGESVSLKVVSRMDVDDRALNIAFRFNR